MILQNAGTTYEITHHHIPQDLTPWRGCRENFKSYTLPCFYKYNYHILAAQLTLECLVLSSFIILVYVHFVNYFYYFIYSCKVYSNFCII
jgi:hypothetical protein